jgi:predicted RNase H-like nuclease (RuvC/YqgF family)
MHHLNSINSGRNELLKIQIEQLKRQIEQMKESNKKPSERIDTLGSHRGDDIDTLKKKLMGNQI